MESPSVPRGVRIGLDVGTVRVGVAMSDPDGIMATPVATLRRDRSITYVVGGRLPTQLPDDVAELLDIMDERDVVAVYVGQPRHLSGKDGASVSMAVNYAALISQLRPEITVRLVDERLTSVTAHSMLTQAGRSTRHQRQVVDQAAAVVILDSALDAEKHSGVRAGTSVPQ